jgi:hypothetical protein
MPRYVERPIDAKVHVVDANGDPVTGASVSVKVLEPSGQDWDGTWSATYLSDGIYYTQFTPDEAGDWTVIFSCGNPKFTKAIVYRVNFPSSFQAPLNGMNQVAPTDTNWYVLFAQNQEDWVQKKLYCVSLRQTNDENAQKAISVIFNLDNVNSINLDYTFDANTEYYLLLSIDVNGNYSYEWLTSKTLILKAGGQDDNGSQWSSIPLECRVLGLQVSIPGGPGTNQTVQAHMAVSVDFGQQGSYIGD